MAYIDQKIMQEHSIEVICQSIWFMMLPLREQLECGDIGDATKKEMEDCAKKLIMIKHRKSNDQSSFVAKKYASSRFMGVADKTFPTICQ